MCWARIKSIFTKQDTDAQGASDKAAAPVTTDTGASTGTGARARKPAKTEAPATPAPFDPVAWQRATPLAYLMDGGRVVTLALAREFSLMHEEDQAAAAEVIKASVVGAMDDALAAGDKQSLREMALAVTDALYKAALRLAEVQVYAAVVAPYIAAVGKPFYAWLQAHGMQVNYCVSNTPKNKDAVWNEFPEFFAATGMVYICPQNIAYQSFKQNAQSEEDFAAEAEHYLNDAFFVARRMQKNCAGQSRSYLCLDADGNKRTYQQTLDYCGRDGHVVAERADAQEPTTWFPEANN